ncbi:winged helix-turn-helix domain-containing protein, partial [uncultured Parabacteroides sp.]
MELEKIGEHAGKVWHELNKGRELSIPELKLNMTVETVRNFFGGHNF